MDLNKSNNKPGLEDGQVEQRHEAGGGGYPGCKHREVPSSAPSPAPAAHYVGK